MATTINRLRLDDVVLARLRQLTRVTVYDGEVPATPTMIPGGSRVAPYLIRYPLWGTDAPETTLCRSGESIVWPEQLTCVAGYRADVRNLASAVNALMWGWLPPVDADLSVGEFYPPPGYQAPLIPEDGESPPRMSIPLQYVSTIST